MAKDSIFKRLISRTIGLLSIAISIALLISYLSPYVSPDSIWWIQLFGLAYPIILISLLILLPVLFFLKRKRFWTLALIMIVGFPVHFRYMSFGSSAEASQNATEIKVTSFNVRGFDIYQWVNKDLSESEESFLKFIKNNNADVICFQEYTVDKRPSKHMLPSEIKSAGDFTYYTEKLTAQSIKLSFGISIYSKYPIIKKGFVGKEKDLYALYADVKIKEDTIRVYNTHLQSIRLQQDEYSLFDENAPSNKGVSSRVGGLLGKLKSAYPGRIAQSNSIIEHAAKSKHPVLICGDFNEPPTSYVYSIFSDNYQDAFRSSSFGIGRTYAGKIPAGRIDHIFCGDSIQPLSFEISDETLMSDHYPISARITLK